MDDTFAELMARATLARQDAVMAREAIEKIAGKSEISNYFSYKSQGPLHKTTLPF